MNNEHWISFLEINAQKFKNKIAVIDQHHKRKLTFEELNNEVNHWAAFLQSNNIKKGDAIAFLHSNCLEHLTLLLACSKIGAMFVPLNFRLSKGELCDVLERLNPALYFGIGEETLHVKNKYIDIATINLNSYTQLTPNYSTMNDPILVLYTSGSTGVPKGVMFHGKMLITNQIETCRNWGLRETDITLVETPFFHTGGYNVLLLPLLYLGGTSIITEHFVPDNVFDCIEKEKISVYFGVPTMFQMLLDKPRFNNTDISSIRFFISGGAACPIPMIEEYQKKGLMFKQGFGLTEIGPNCFLLDEKYAKAKAGSIGIPMSHTEVKLVNSDGTESKVNEPGELLIKGPHLCLSYLNNDAGFKNNLVDGYFRTGDLLRFDEDGFYYVVGRIKDMYISGGENVYPGEVEKQLTHFDGVDDAVVVSMPDEKWGEVGLAYLKTEKDICLIELREFLNSCLSRYKHPHHVVCLKTFPLLPNGKVDRKKLKEESKIHLDSSH
jgi:fatty-acyl-CoA synthase